MVAPSWRVMVRVDHAASLVGSGRAGSWMVAWRAGGIWRGARLSTVTEPEDATPASHVTTPEQQSSPQAPSASRLRRSCRMSSVCRRGVVRAVGRVVREGRRGFGSRNLLISSVAHNITYDIMGFEGCKNHSTSRPVRHATRVPRATGSALHGAPGGIASGVCEREEGEAHRRTGCTGLDSKGHYPNI